MDVYPGSFVIVKSIVPFSEGCEGNQAAFHSMGACTQLHEGYEGLAEVARKPNS